MQITIPHQFSKAQAKERVVQALSEARGKLAGQATIDREEWEGDTLHFGFTAQGQAISGTFEVRESVFLLLLCEIPAGGDFFGELELPEDTRCFVFAGNFGDCLLSFCSSISRCASKRLIGSWSPVAGTSAARNPFFPPMSSPRSWSYSG